MTLLVYFFASTAKIRLPAAMFYGGRKQRDNEFFLSLSKGAVP